MLTSALTIKTSARNADGVPPPERRLMSEAIPVMAMLAAFVVSFFVVARR